VVWLPVDAQGVVSVDALREELERNSDEVALVTSMWANNEIGTVQPVAELAALAAEHGVPLHTDAVQAVGQVPVDFAGCGASALTVTGHKVGGPNGVGALLVGREVPVTPLLHGGGQERDIRSGTLDVAGISAFAVAVELAVKRQAELAGRLTTLRDDLVARVRSVVPEAVLSGHPSNRLPGNAHFTFPGCEGDALLLLLDAAGVACSTGSACSAGIAQPSHVLLAMGADDVTARSTLRFTLGHTSSGADVDELIAALPGAVERARRAGALRAPEQ
jgi:cysteine desulfurase